MLTKLKSEAKYSLKGARRIASAPFRFELFSGSIHFALPGVLSVAGWFQMRPRDKIRRFWPLVNHWHGHGSGHHRQGHAFRLVRFTGLCRFRLHFRLAHWLDCSSFSFFLRQPRCLPARYIARHNLLHPGWSGYSQRSTDQSWALRPGEYCA